MNSAGVHRVQPGDVIHNPVHGETMRFLELSDSGHEPVLRVEMTVEPQASGPPAHTHPLSTETFEMLSGATKLRTGRDVQVLTEGHQVSVDAKSSHKFWNHTSQEAVVTIEWRPGMAMAAFLDSWFQLARDGHLNRKGLASPLQTAVLFDAYLDSIVLPVIPIAVQRQLLRVLGRWGRSRGYNP